MATFLGLALGTVSTLAVVELILRNAFERSSVIVCSSAAGGLLAICMVQLCIPKSKAASCDQASVHTSFNDALPLLEVWLAMALK